MATFVLVHGAWVGAFYWRPVARALRADGHEVYTPTLTGVGERSHLLSAAVDLDTHITDVLNVIAFEGLSDVVLVGHSYGGMVVTGVADRVPEAIRALVYLDAFVPENGQSLSALTGGRVAVPPGAAALPMLPLSYWKVAPDKAAIIAAWPATPHPAQTMLQPIALTGGIDRIARRIFIYANDPAPTAFTQFYERFRAAPGWETHTLPCTHFVQLDMPDALTRLLLAAAAPLH